MDDLGDDSHCLAFAALLSEDRTNHDLSGISCGWPAICWRLSSSLFDMEILMIDIVNRLRFDATRCEAQFSKGVAGNITEAADEIERLRKSIEHNEQAIRACNQKISELELWGKDYREQIAFWKAKAGA